MGDRAARPQIVCLRVNAVYPSKVRGANLARWWMLVTAQAVTDS